MMYPMIFQQTTRSEPLSLGSNICLENHNCSWKNSRLNSKLSQTTTISMAMFYVPNCNKLPFGTVLNQAMENGPFVSDFPSYKPPFGSWIPAMFDETRGYQRLTISPRPSTTSSPGRLGTLVPQLRCMPPLRIAQPEEAVHRDAPGRALGGSEAHPPGARFEVGFSWGLYQP